MIVLILSLLLQSLNVAGMGLMRKNLKDFDDILNQTTNMDDNKGYYNSVIASACISMGIYIFLIITIGLGKSCSPRIDWLALHLVILLQFAIATTIAIYLRN